MLKASKADKEALEDGDINSILFSFNKIDETNFLQEVHWFYSHLTEGEVGGAQVRQNQVRWGRIRGGTVRSLLSQKQDLKVYRNWMLKCQLQCGRSLILFQILKLK